MTLSDKTYDALKWVAQYLLPALGTLYFALASIWGWGYGEQVIGTISAIDTFLGVLLGISSNNYIPDTDGSIDVVTDKGGTVIEKMDIDDPQNFVDKGTITLQVISRNR